MTTSVAPGLGAAREQQVDDRGAGRGVEVAGRLVGEDQRRGAARARGRSRRAAARRPKAARDSGRAGGRGRPRPVPPRRASQASRHARPAPAASRRFPARSSSAAGGRPAARCRSARAARAPARPRPSAPKSARRRSTVPPLARSSPDSTAISDDLPDPDGPSSATLSPARDVQVDAAQDLRRFRRASA